MNNICVRNYEFAKVYHNRFFLFHSYLRTQPDLFWQTRETLFRLASTTARMLEGRGVHKVLVGKPGGKTIGETKT